MISNIKFPLNTMIKSDITLLKETLQRTDETMGRLLCYDVIGYIENAEFNVLINPKVDFTYANSDIHVSGYDENKIFNELILSKENAKFINI